MDGNNNVTKITIKNTEFIAEAVFAEDARETACDKIKRLITDSLKYNIESIQDTLEI